METNIFQTHFKEFSRIAKNNTEYTRKGKPIISLTDTDYNDTIGDDETSFSKGVKDNAKKDDIQPRYD